MKRKPTKRSLSDITLEEAHGGSGHRQLIFSNQDAFVCKNFQAMTKGFLPPGASYDWHKHDAVDEFFLVVSGVGKIKYDDGSEFEYRGGDLFYSPAGISHILTNTGLEENVFYFIRISE